MSDYEKGKKFKKGDRIAYLNYDGELTPGTIITVQRTGYRIRWDDGYIDLPGRQGVYPEEELVGLKE